MGRAQHDATEMSTRLSLKMEGLQEPVSGLSGGNAQKVVIGKWLLRNPRVLLLDDPTKGVDVGTKAEFYKLLTQLCAEGKSVLFYSSDDEELIGLCDRVLVMHDGAIRAELAGESLTKANLIAASLGALSMAPHEAAMKRLNWQDITYRNPYLFALSLLILAILVNFILQPNLFERSTLNNNMRVFLPLIFLSAGEAVVILAGGIDISIGAIVSVVNALLATQIGLKGDPGQVVLWMIVALYRWHDRGGHQRFLRRLSAFAADHHNLRDQLPVCGCGVVHSAESRRRRSLRCSLYFIARPRRWACRWLFISSSSFCWPGM